MADGKRNAPLRGRVVPARPVRLAGDGDIEKMLRVEFPRIADQLLALEADIQAVAFEATDKAGLVSRLSETDLVCLIDRQDADTGLMVVDCAMLAGLIEVQTLGQISNAPPKERVPTRTDAVIVSEILDQWLLAASKIAREQDVAESLIILDYERQPGALGLRAVELTLDPGDYRSLRVTFALGGGAKIGALTYFVPKSGDGARIGDQQSLGDQLQPHLLTAPVELDVTLTRLVRPLDKVMQFEVGQVLPILPEDLTRVQVEAFGQDNPIATGRLGQVNGFRAVRLTQKEGEEFVGQTVVQAGAGLGVPISPKGGHNIDATPNGLSVDEAAGSVEGAPDLPDLPGGLDLSPPGIEPEGLPDLPELPDLPDLPDLPNLPVG